ncbi:MAG: permease YjgP/YjgQ family protein [Verrucomicrobia bacterium]|nr:permease YjgP/YjgQ family protein [Verrucomicrobiota bacterium]
MTLIDRYIFRSVLATCAAAVGVFTFIVLVPNVIRDMLSYVLQGLLSPLMFCELILTLLPFAVTLALPMGLLTGVLLTLGRLSADSEVTAMRSVGLSLPRISWPILLLAFLGCAVGLYCNFEAMPRARVTYEKNFAAAVASNPLQLIVPKTFIRNFSNCVIYVDQKEGSVMKDVWVWKLDGEKRVKTLIHAESGYIDYAEATNELIVTLTQARVENRDEKDPENFVDSPYVATFGKIEAARLSLDRFFGHGGVRVKQEWLTLRQLQDERARVAALPRPSGPEGRQFDRDRMKLELVYHDKLNTALAVFSLALLGIPLGIKVSRRETSANFGVALLLTLGYYLLTVAVKALDRHPEYRPDLLLWLPNLLIITVGVWLFSRIDRK